MSLSLLVARLTDDMRTSIARQAAIGLAFGAAVWLVNFQIVARLLYPWFLMAPQFLQAMMHAVMFGLPLGLLFAAGERRAVRARAVPAA